MREREGKREEGRDEGKGERKKEGRKGRSEGSEREGGMEERERQREREKEGHSIVVIIFFKYEDVYQNQILRWYHKMVLELAWNGAQVEVDWNVDYKRACTIASVVVVDPSPGQRKTMCWVEYGGDDVTHLQTEVVQKRNAFREEAVFRGLHLVREKIDWPVQVIYTLCAGNELVFLVFLSCVGSIDHNSSNNSSSSSEGNS